MGQTRLGGFFVICVLQLILQWIDLPLRGQRRSFSPRSSVSSSITHRSDILCLHYSSLLFQLLVYYCKLMNMTQSSYIVCSLAFTLFRTQLSQSKINRVIILIWGFKQLLYFHTNSSFQKKNKKRNQTQKPNVKRKEKRGRKKKKKKKKTRPDLTTLDSRSLKCVYLPKCIITLCS